MNFSKARSPSTMKEQYAEIIQDRLDGDKKLWNTIQYIIKEIFIIRNRVFTINSRIIYERR